MDFLRDIYKKDGKIHHAYAFGGDKTSVLADLLKFLEKDFGVEVRNNPDYYHREFETFTIDDGRDLQEIHGRRAISGKKIFIILTRFVTSEAQNALLKIFEEPSEGSHFFLIMPNTQVLIPTLRSRLVVMQSDFEDKNFDLAKKFISTNVAERLVLVKSIIEEKDKGKAIDFVTALEGVLAEKFEKNESVEGAGALAEILMVKKYLHDRSPSVKLLLEHLCLFVTIPKL